MGASQRALEGLSRSLAKESGKKAITSQILYVAPDAENNIGACLDFLLSYKSAYVNAQVIRVTAADQPQTDAAKPLAGKRALVTGASRGIGYGVARAFAQHGANLHILAQGEEVHDAARQIADETGQGVTGWTCDITDSARVDEVFALAGQLDVFVANAGLEAVTLISDRSAAAEAQFRRVTEINTIGTYLTTRAALPPASRRARSRQRSTISAGMSAGSMARWARPRVAASPTTRPISASRPPGNSLNSNGWSWSPPISARFSAGPR